MDKKFIKDFFGYSIKEKWHYENGFYLTSDPTRIPKILAHYELYKLIKNIPGQILECGVFKGASFIRFCSFRDCLENSFSRKIIGFDAFGSFPKQDNVNDIKFIEQFEEASGSGISYSDFIEVLEYKRIQNYELVEGDIIKTIPEYILNHPELKISLLHIDVDVYQPTKVILESLFSRMSKGGLILLDDYSSVAGETDAVDEFFKEKKVRIQKLSIAHTPSYIIVE